MTENKPEMKVCLAEVAEDRTYFCNQSAEAFEYM